VQWWIYVLSTEEQAADTQISCLAAIREHLRLGKPGHPARCKVLQLAGQMHRTRHVYNAFPCSPVDDACDAMSDEIGMPRVDFAADVVMADGCTYNAAQALRLLQAPSLRLPRHNQAALPARSLLGEHSMSRRSDNAAHGLGEQPALLQRGGLSQRAAGTQHRAAVVSEVAMAAAAAAGRPWATDRPTRPPQLQRQPPRTASTRTRAAQQAADAPGPSSREPSEPARLRQTGKASSGGGGSGGASGVGRKRPMRGGTNAACSPSGSEAEQSGSDPDELPPPSKHR